MVDWKKFFWNVPGDLKSCQRLIRINNLMFYIVLVVFLLVLSGTQQMEDELNFCNDQLVGYRSSYEQGGFPVSSCGVVDGYLLCDIDNFTIARGN